jgi:hypothetical protein
MHNSCFSIGKMAARSPAKETCARILNLVFANTCPKRSFSIIENECFGLVFAKTGSINSGIEKGHRHVVFTPSFLKGLCQFTVRIDAHGGNYRSTLTRTKLYNVN